jgi:hypothetical protein
MNSTTFTHKGWFWFCPIYWAEDGADGCVVDVRSPWQEPLFYVCEGLEALRISLSCMLWEDYEPSHSFRVEALAAPIVRQWAE